MTYGIIPGLQSEVFRKHDKNSNSVLDKNEYENFKKDFKHIAEDGKEMGYDDLYKKLSVMERISLNKKLDTSMRSEGGLSQGELSLITGYLIKSAFDGDKKA